MVKIPAADFQFRVAGIEIEGRKEAASRTARLDAVFAALADPTRRAMLDRLAKFGATPVAERVVVDGKVITGAGVSAGIDMALRLAALVAGDRVAQSIQLGIEYDPQPPFDAGSPAKAPPRSAGG